ncbi:MAG: hypothetical protein JEZ01_12545 [Labilibaculum sp.]|nr:hypothetical protein [Labilibaculum sp.]MBI9058585.1 hypothetical protein [Labilibaculum sp.]
MKKSDIIDLALKIFGFYIIASAILYLQNFHYLRLMATVEANNTNYTGLGIFIGFSLLVFVIGYLLIFKSTKIARKICKNDFDINLSFDLNYSKVLEISLMILGLIILIFKFSSFVSSITQIVSQFTSIHPQSNPSIAFSVATLLQYILGYILLTNAKALSNWIIRVNQKNIGKA